MVKYFFILAWRNIRNNILHSLINIVGFSVGLCCFLLIALLIDYQYSYEKFHHNYKRIFLVEEKAVRINDQVSYTRYTPYPLLADLNRKYPEIESWTRLLHTEEQFGIPGKTRKLKEQGLYADSSFFSIFTYQFLTGEPKTALHSPGSIVLTKSFSERIFGVNPYGKILGQEIIVGDSLICKITAIIDDPPSNTVIRFNYVLSIPTLDQVTGISYETDWRAKAINFVMLYKSTDYQFVTNKISNYLHNINEDFENHSLFLLPLEKMLLDNPGDTKKGRIVNMAIILTVFILMISAANFISLRSANSITRLKETTIKKIHGSNRFMIILQWIGEAMLITFFAFDLALIMAELLLPVFNRVVSSDLRLIYADNWDFIVMVLLISLFIGIFAGVVPALRISGIKSVELLKTRTGKFSSKGRMRKFLVGFQLVLTVFFISSAFIMRLQFRYIHNKDKGFQEEGVLVHRFLASPSDPQQIIQFRTLRDELISNPFIENASLSKTTPFLGHPRFDIYLDETAPEDKILVVVNNVDRNYLNTMGLSMVEGRNFTSDDQPGTVCLINETAREHLGKDKIVGSLINPGKIEIIGVVEDYHLTDMNWIIRPCVLLLRNDTIPYENNVLLIKLSGNDLQTSKDAIQNEIEDFFPDKNIELTWFEDMIPYDVISAISGSFAFFSALAILISIIGLFGMISYSVVARSKEIGIRKALGATARKIFNMILRSYVILVINTSMIACPMAYFIMKKFMQIFAYRIDIPVYVFILAGLITFLITLATISYHLIKASVTNPVRELRYE